MTFGTRLKELREEQNIRRKELSITLNINYNTLSKYETDVRFPSIENLLVLSDYYNVSLDYLYCRTNNRKINF